LETTLLCVGDMHLGRRPSRLPEWLESEYGISTRGLDSRAAWRLVVEKALELEVDALLLAGDVVDSNNGFMEAYGALYEGVSRLTAGGVEVIAVAGNHDVKVLPRLADELDGFHLLGRRGVWESHVIRREGEALLRVLGWSFPSRHVDASPLDDMPGSLKQGRYDDGLGEELSTVGLLHCDLDASGDRYAPVATSALVNLGLSAWFLGHVHAPSIPTSGRPIGYLGSLVGLDPGELGARGAWVARRRPSSWELERVELAPVRWEATEVDIEACVNDDEVEAALLRSMRELHEALSPTFEGTRVVGCRPHLVGTTSLTSGDLHGVLARAGDMRVKHGEVVYFVDKAFDDTEPRLDLQALALQSDPVGIVAKRILDLRRDTPAGRALVAQAGARLEEVAAHRNLHSLGGAGLESDAVRDLLLRTATTALSELLAQKNSSTPARRERGEEVRV